ncbi:hypothetical protein Hanom_Chr08g00747331 [Helianthus anomalus]
MTSSQPSQPPSWQDQNRAPPLPYTEPPESWAITPLASPHPQSSHPHCHQD